MEKQANTTCKHCENNFSGNYCPECGQSAHTHPINFRELWHDIQHGLFHFDRGILFNVKELYTRPGHSIAEYIKGKRVRHFKPISFVVFFAGLFGLSHHLLEIESSIDIDGLDGIAQSTVAFSKWVQEHYALAEILLLPLLALGSYTVFRKSGYNFAEHLVISAFLSGQRLILRLLFLPFVYFLQGSPNLHYVERANQLIILVLLFWAYKQLFQQHHSLRVFLRILAMVILWLLELTGLLFILHYSHIF